MKAFLVIFPALSALAAAAPALHDLRPRQLNTIAGAFLRTQKIYSIEHARSDIDRPGVRRARIKLGPFDLRPGNERPWFGMLSTASMDPAGTAFVRKMPDEFPRDITILTSRTAMQYGDGSPANITTGVYDHHFMLDNLSRAPASIFGCRGASTGFPTPGAVIAARAEDQADLRYTSADGKFDSGVYVGENDFIALWVDLVNYQNNTQTVYAVTEIDYLDGKDQKIMDASIQAMYLGQCDSWIPGDGFQIHPPEGQPKFSRYGGNVSVLKDGYLLSLNGHMHDGGVSVQVALNGKEICESRAIYGNSTSMGGMGGMHGNSTASSQKYQTISSMSQCEGPFPVFKGDNITMIAHYDTITHPARPQVGGTMGEQMAMLAGVFALKKS